MVFLVWGRNAENNEKKEENRQNKTFKNEENEKWRIQRKSNDNNIHLWFYFLYKKSYFARKHNSKTSRFYHHILSALIKIWINKSLSTVFCRRSLMFVKNIVNIEEQYKFIHNSWQFFNFFLNFDVSLVIAHLPPPTVIITLWVRKSVCDSHLTGSYMIC